MRAWLGLVHHPVRDRAGDVITTAVTNLDVHDIARTCRSYDLAGYLVVTPIEAQRALVERILSHWRTGAGARRVPERAEALRITEVVPSIDAAVARVAAAEGEPPRVIATSARPTAGVPEVRYEGLGRELRDRPGLLLFGTGHGLTRETLEGVDGLLPPIRPRAEYNHLSVRAAVAITLDRLFGDGGD